MEYLKPSRTLLKISQMPVRPCKTGSAGKSRRDHFSHWNERSIIGKIDRAEAIINLAMCVKTKSCGVSISSITVRKGEHQNKVQEVNDQLRDLHQAKNVYFIDHGKSIKPQYLKSRLHLTRRGTSILTLLGKHIIFFIGNIFNMVQIQMNLPVVTNPVKINLKLLEKPAKLTM